MTTIPLDQLNAVPYLDVSRLEGRRVKLMPLWDGRRWRMWLPTTGRLIETNPIEAVMTDYVGVGAAKESDLLIPFVELMWQRASWPEVCPLISAICLDFHHMGTSIAKLRHVFRTREIVADQATLFAATELEYLLILSRSVFDLLQEIIARIWNGRVRLNEPTAERKRRARALPETFSRIILRDKKQTRTAQDIETTFGLPDVIAGAYADQAAFFSQLRDARDAIVHGSGSGLGYIYSTERGFCVSPHDAPFDQFTQWADAHRYSETLVSILPWLGHIVFGTVFACNALMDAFSAVVVFPPELAPGHHVYVRGPCNDALVEVLGVVRGTSAWWNSSNEIHVTTNQEALYRRVQERAYYLWKERVTDKWWDDHANWLMAEQIEGSLGTAG